MARLLVRSTYKPPSRKTPERAILCLRSISSCHTMGSGRTSMIVLRRMFGMPDPMKKVLRSMQRRGSIVRSQKARAGWHWANTATSIAKVKAVTRPSVT